MLVFVAVRIEWSQVAGLAIADVSENLPLERREKIKRFVRAEDKYRSAIGGHLINHLFHELRPGRPIPALTKGTHGKPAFATDDAPAFNISHSGDWVVGIAGNGPVGVDVEEIKPQAKVLTEVLSADEIEVLKSIPTLQRVRYFICLWSLKEAHLKAQGVGLGQIAPADLTFQIGADGESSLTGCSGKLVHQTAMLDARHVYATCTPRPAPASPRVIDANDFLTGQLKLL